MGNFGETNWLALLRVDRAEVWVFAAVFAIRAAYALAVLMLAGEHGFLAFSDAQAFYYQEALNLLNHHSFSIAPSAPFLPDGYHTILYPLFVAGLLVLHLPLFGVVIVQDILAAVAVLLIYRSAISLTNSRQVAIVAATLAAIEPMSIYWSGLLMSDTLLMFLMIVAFYLLLAKQPYWSGGALGLATLTRPIGPYLVPVFLGMIVYQEIGRALFDRDWSSFGIDAGDLYNCCSALVRQKQIDL